MGDKKISEAARFTKRPVTIEAMQFDGSAKSASAICQWANAGDDASGHDDPTVSYTTMDGDDAAHNMVVWTLEDAMSASPGDWIIKGVKGEFYPCKPDIFELTYSPHLQGEAVPVGYRWRHSAGEAWQYSDVPCGWEFEPLFAHPQPAELSEVSGDSGESGERQSAWNDSARLACLESWAREPGGLLLHAESGTGRRGLGLGENCGRRTLAKAIDSCATHAEKDSFAALAATGKQQVGGFPWENFPAYLIDKCEGGTISEEGIQRAVADMAKDSRYATAQQVGEVQGSREQFEAWAVSIGARIDKDEHENYLSSALNYSKLGWDAAIASRQPVGAQGIDMEDVLHKAADLARGGSSAIAVVGWITSELIDGRDAGAGVDRG